MGDVWLAENQTIHKKAAIKVLHPELATRDTILQRFFNEARAANLVEHPSIVGVWDCGVAPGIGAYLVMEYLDGESLGRRIRRGPRFGVAETARLVGRIASALGAAHARGIIHRDLKPDNVFLLPDPDHPGEDRVKVLDFGIAKLMIEQARAGGETQTGALMGTPEYMSPEQCDGAKGVDHRTDVYALGIIAYKVLCGRAPFVAEGKGELLAMQLREAPPALRTFRADVPPEIEAVVMRALEKDPARRWQAIDDMGRAMLSAAGLDTGSLPVAHARASRPLPAAPPPADDLVTYSAAPLPDQRTGPSTLAGSASEFGSTSNVMRRVPGPVLAGLALGVTVALAAGVVWIASSTRTATEEEGRRPVPGAATGAAGDDDGDRDDDEGEARGGRDGPLVRVSLSIDSDPGGAELYRASDGVRLGITPWTGDFARGSGDAMFLVKKAGWREERVALSVSESGARLVHLSPDAPATGRSASDSSAATAARAKARKAPPPAAAYKPPVPD